MQPLYQAFCDIAELALGCQRYGHRDTESQVAMPGEELAGLGPISVGAPSFLEGAVTPALGWRVAATPVALDDYSATLLSVTRSDDLAF